MPSFERFSYIATIKPNYNLFYWCLMLVVCTSFSASVQDFENVFRKPNVDDYGVCMSNFEIHQDKIIRTEESKKMGAKYLNGKDVTSKEECVKFCCKTPSCNVFVLEEKVYNQQQGTCYLFECGSPDNFKCKFTRHHNYSSAVLIINRPQIQLEDEIQYSQHERELTSLRNGKNATKPENCHSKKRVRNDESNNLIDAKESPREVEETEDTSFRKTGKCSRFQFECRSSGECIAIYNACDGIPQCADHSDEDVELGCPTNVPLLSRNANHIMTMQKQPINENILNRNLANGVEEPYKIPYKGRDMVESALPIGSPVEQNGIVSSGMNSPRKTNLWPTKVNLQTYKSRPIHNYGRKQNDINTPYNYGEFGSDELNPLYDGYNIGNTRNNLYPVNVNPWRSQMNAPDLEMKNIEIPRSKPVVEYYYEENNTPLNNGLESTLPQRIKQPDLIRNATTKSNKEYPITTEKVNSTSATKTSSPKMGSTSSMDSTTTEATTSKHNDHERTEINLSEKVQEKSHSHRKLEKPLSAEISGVKESYLDASVEHDAKSSSQQPSGTFISLTLGLGITFMLIFIVGYRLRVVRKRIRRGGKLPYAHDADYLVNGMYL